ncbi:MAG: alpha/beta hydrolase [Angelakisella sp.]
MAISNIMRATLRAISRHDLNVCENYQRTRVLFDAAHPPLASPYQMWDKQVSVDGHIIPVRLFLPEKGLPEHIAVFFHGGGWVTGNIDSYTNVCARIANQTGSMVISVDYRLAPECPFPAGLEDCYAVAKEVITDTNRFGLDSERVLLIGDSAGGNLAAAVSLLAKQRGEFMPAKQILIYPCTYNDHSPASPFASVVENGSDYILTAKRVCDYLELYLGDNDENWNSPYFAPLLAEDLTGQPETLILTAEFCPLRDEGEQYGKRLQQAGCKTVIHRIPDAIHGFFALPLAFPAVRQSFDYMNEFLQEQ